MNRNLMLLLFVIGVILLMVYKASSSVVKRMADAIQAFEGYYTGSRSYMNNNPGNIKYVGQALAIGQDDDGFAVYATYEDGRADLERNIRNAMAGLFGYSPTMTIYAFFSKYSPDGNSGNYAAYVANKLGVTVDTRLMDLV